MHGPPTDLSEAELRTALVAGWRIEPSSIAYAPVGFGSHHWIIPGVSVLEPPAEEAPTRDQLDLYAGDAAMAAALAGGLRTDLGGRLGQITAEPLDPTPG